MNCECLDRPEIVVTIGPDVARRVREEAAAVVEHGRSNKTERFGAQTDPERQANRLQRNVDGFAAEEAAASYFGVTRTQRGIVVKDFATDLTNRVQVRQTAHATGSLIVHPDDRDEEPFLLAVGTMPMFRLVGWILARDAKAERWWQTPPAVRFPAYFVPQAELHRLPLHGLDMKARRRFPLIYRDGKYEYIP